MPPPKTAGSPRGTVKGASSQNIVKFTIRAAPLPPLLLDFILDNLSILWKFERDRRAVFDPLKESEEESIEVEGEMTRKPTIKADQFWPALQEVLNSIGGEWAGILEQIWMFGPHQAGGCVLIDARKTGAMRSWVSFLMIISASLSAYLPRFKQRLTRAKAGDPDVDGDKTLHDFDNCIETGFQLATFQGPLCAEPVEGVAYFVEDLDIDREGLEKEIGVSFVSSFVNSMPTMMDRTKPIGAGYGLCDVSRQRCM